MVRQGSSLTWLSIRIGLQGLKPRESNKLFDLFFLPHPGHEPVAGKLGKIDLVKMWGDDYLFCIRFN